jgi:hypothetical protein
MAVTVGILFQIILVIVFGRIIVVHWQDFGCKFRAILGFDFGDIGFDCRQVNRIQILDPSPVLRAPIITLLIDRCSRSEGWDLPVNYD